jgi:RimJ/RimL family protein N-acetyltransferase
MFVGAGSLLRHLIPGPVAVDGCSARCDAAEVSPFQNAVLTPRLELHLPREADRALFVDLFRDEEFMIFGSGGQSPEAAHRRFDHMLAFADEYTFAKQPVVERATGSIVGYVGVDRFTFEGHERLEFGWRFVAEARGKGYATEAGSALLGLAEATYKGELYAIIHPENAPSHNVARKLGFTYWKRTHVDGFLVDIYRHNVG